MTFADMVALAWEENRLFSVLVELTYRCNLDCFFCYNDRSLRGEPLSRDDYRRLLEDLAQMQVFQLVLTGGEPFAHPHVFEIGTRARELGFVVRIKSNGHALSRELARRVRRDLDPFVVEVSLHGATAATHDRQTRVPGSFDRLLGNLDEMREAGLHVRLNGTLTAWNESEVEAMYALADGRRLALTIDTAVSPRDDGDATPLSISPSAAGLRRLLQVRKRRADEARAGEGCRPDSARAESSLAPATTEPSKHCGAGSASLAVDPVGNVFPCVQWRVPLGNLHERRISEIWRSSSRLQEVREQASAARRLLPALGLDPRRAPFCPGLAEQRTGSPLRLYPGVAETAAIDAEVAGEVDPGA